MEAPGCQDRPQTGSPSGLLSCPALRGPHGQPLPQGIQQLLAWVLGLYLTLPMPDSCGPAGALKACGLSHLPFAAAVTMCAWSRAGQGYRLTVELQVTITEQLGPGAVS